MRVAFLIERRNLYRLLGPVVDRALERGWEIECWHDWGQPRTGPKGSEFPATTPDFRHGRPAVRTFVGADGVAALCAGARPDAVIALRQPAAGEKPMATRWFGLQYTLDVAELPEQAIRDPIRRVLVSLGGGCHDAALRTVLAAVDATLDCVTIDVAPGARGAMDLGFVARRPANRAVVHAGLPELRGLILDSDVAITGAGMTLYELAATGTPTVTITMVGNQAASAAALSGAGAALSVGIVDGAGRGTALESHLGRLARDVALRAELGRRARSRIDGRGAVRVAQETERMVGSAR